MVTEEQRLQLLQILSIASLDLDNVSKKIEELTGKKITSEEINAAIKQLKSVKGC
jgi:U3 small nucleolar RNA-associated protein 14